MANEPSGKCMPAEMAGAEKCDNLGHDTGKCCIPPYIELTVLDYRTQSPVTGALLRSIDVTCDDKAGVGQKWISDSLGFDFSWPVEYREKFTQTDEQNLVRLENERDLAIRDEQRWDRVTSGDDTPEPLIIEHLKIGSKVVQLTEQMRKLKRQKGAEAEARSKEQELSTWNARWKAIQKDLDTAKANLKKARDKISGHTRQIDRLITHRNIRRNWVRHLQYLLRMHDAWEWNIDGLEGDGFQTRVNQAWRKAMKGKACPKEPKAMIEALYYRLKGTLITGEKGFVKVYLPVPATGTVKIEMAHLKIIAPDKVKNFKQLRSAGVEPRVQFDKDRKDADDDPRNRNPMPAKESHWTLVLANGQKAPFQNYIEMRFDTTGENAKCLKFPESTLALMWCQPAWTLAGEKDYIMPEGESLNDGRGLSDSGHPTLLISSSVGASGKAYGIYGHARTESEQPKYGELTEQFGDVWVAWARAWVRETVYSSSSEAAEYVYSLPDAIERSARKWTEIPPLIAPFLCRLTAPQPSDSAAGVDGSAERTLKHLSLVRLEPRSERNEPPYWYRLRIPKLELAWEFKDSEPRYQVWRRKYTKWKTQEEAERQIANEFSEQKKIVEGVDKEGRPGWKVCWTNATGLDVMYSEVYVEWGQVKEVFQHRMHMGIDIAGRVGDPVFAPVGGVVEGLRDLKIGGKTVRIVPWNKNCNVTFIVLHHNKKLSCEQNMIVKAGDQVAFMGRTGNPETESPTHVHFWAGKGGKIIDFSEKALEAAMPRYCVVFPHNDLPVLLPCAGEYGKRGKHPAEHEAAGQEDLKKNPGSYPNMCRLRNNDANGMNATLCWAYKDKICPYAFQHGELIAK